MNYFLAAATGDHTRVLRTLFMMLVAAKLMAELFERGGPLSMKNPGQA